MATVVSGNTVKLDNGQTVTAQNGGWYDGQQFFNGSLGAASVINNPNQQGYGQAVSKEVVAQTNPSNVTYLANKGASLPTFSSVNDAHAYLNDAQNGVYSNYSAPNTPQVETTDQIATDLRTSGLLPTTPRPTAPNLAQTYQTLSTQAGVDKIQADINDLKAQQDLIAEQARINKQAEQSKPVAQNVIEGRISQEQQQSQDQYDFLTRQITAKTNELNAAVTNIKAIMDYTQTDYQNASDAYDKQFSEAISTINLVHGIQQDEKTDVQKAQDNARANAQIYVNAITSGNIDIKNLPPDQQAQLNKLEVQAGLPIGFFQSLNKDPKADIVATNDVNGQIQVLTRNPDGTMSLQKYGTPTKGSGTTTTDLNSKAVQLLRANANSYGDVSPQVWQQVRAAYIQDGGTADEFNKEFAGYADTNRGDFENAYGFKNPAS